jgi:hypothetical protein
MATKAELEAEVDQLREDLAAMRAQAETRLRSAADTVREKLPQASEVDAVLSDVAAELKRLPEKNPLLLAAAALALGYLLGRAR